MSTLLRRRGRASQKDSGGVGNPERQQFPVSLLGRSGDALPIPEQDADDAGIRHGRPLLRQSFAPSSAYGGVRLPEQPTVPEPRDSLAVVTHRQAALAGLVGGTLLVGLAAVAGCSPRQGATQRATTPTTTPSAALVTPRPVSTTQAPEPTVIETTPVPVLTTVFRPGELIILTQGDEDLAEIVVDKVKQRTKYSGEFSDDEPAPGNVYIEMFVTYRALAENADYSSFDWDVFVDDLAIDGYTFLINGPEPTLSSGSLPKGRRAEGWLIFEIPTKGRAVLSYGANMFSDDPPAFEVILRNK